ncbi:Transferase [Parasponia andersonii]|uniref:Transferase n=1 Tax=Parasponia andersonii TaxID=3476 RepID=A0A2P5D355_PARAD|nr:Transferase [Parasponia andersonii]
MAVKFIDRTMVKPAERAWECCSTLSQIEDSGNRIELDCNGKRVEYLEADSELRLDDFGDEKLPPPIKVGSLVGEINLAIGISHAVADCQSAFGFNSEWASLTRGKAVKTRPYINGKVLGAGEPASVPLDEDLCEYYLPELLTSPDAEVQINSIGGDEMVVTKSKTTMAMLRLSKTHVEKLREMAGLDEDNRRYTSFDTLAWQVWRCACKARKHTPEQPTSLAICVHSCRRVSPPRPKGFFGSTTFDVTAAAFSGELVSQTELSEFRGSLPTQSDSPLLYCNPNLGIVSWLTLPLYGHDFGWGKEIYTVLGEVQGRVIVSFPWFYR